jgi:hypothetical protein
MTVANDGVPPKVRAAGPEPRGSGRLDGPTTLLAGVLAVLAATAALTGLLADGAYGPPAATAEMLRAFDLVTLAVVPALAAATVLARRGSAAARLVMAGLVAHLGYAYAYDVFGTGFNDLFLLHAAILATGTVALVLTLVHLDAGAVTPRLAGWPGARAAAVLLGVLAVSLGALWSYAAVHNAVTGEIPAGSRLVETDTVVHLGMALDLVLLVPLYAAAAVLLWRRRPWGFVLAAVALVAGVLQQVGYQVAMLFQSAAGIPGAVAFDPGEPLVALLYVVAGVLLLRGAVRRRVGT